VRQSSPREGINSGCGFDFRWGGNGADGRSGHEARGAGGGSVLLEEGQGWGSALYRCCGGVEEGGRWEAATRRGEAGTTCGIDAAVGQHGAAGTSPESTHVG
jgi:hypothetical protein